MGYRSDVIIALDNKIIFRDLVTQEIPKWIRELPSVKEDNATYYRIDGWKWYYDATEVQDIEEYFDKLESEDEILFGAIRVGESPDDIQEWGRPYDYDVYVQSSIYSPVNF